MLTDELKEKNLRFLKEVQSEFIRHVGEQRLVFPIQPYLSGVLRALYYFFCSIEAEHELAGAFSSALRVCNESYETFGADRIYSFPRYFAISELLEPKAVAKLKQILLDTLKDRQWDTR